MNPVFIYLTKYTFPNLPYPSLLRNLKFYLEILLGCILSLKICLGFDLKKAGEEFGETRRFEEC
jgi:hypothetical protein